MNITKGKHLVIRTQLAHSMHRQHNRYVYLVHDTLPTTHSDSDSDCAILYLHITSVHIENAILSCIYQMEMPGFSVYLIT